MAKDHFGRVAKQQQVTTRKRESHALKKVGGQLHRLVLETALLRHPRKVDNARREDTRHASSSEGVALFVCDVLFYDVFVLLLFLFCFVFCLQTRCRRDRTSSRDRRTSCLRCTT